MGSKNKKHEKHDEKHKKDRDQQVPARSDGESCYENKKQLH